MRRLIGLGGQHFIIPIMMISLWLGGAFNDWAGVAWFAFLSLIGFSPSVWLVGDHLVSIHLVGGRGTGIRWCRLNEVMDIVDVQPLRPAFFLWTRDGLMALKLRSGRTLPIPFVSIPRRQWQYGRDRGLFALVQELKDHPMPQPDKGVLGWKPSILRGQQEPRTGGRNSAGSRPDDARGDHS